MTDSEKMMLSDAIETAIRAERDIIIMRKIIIVQAVVCVALASLLLLT